MIYTIQMLISLVQSKEIEMLPKQLGDFSYDYQFITDSQEILTILEYFGIEKFYDSVTGAMVLVSNGDYSDVWLTENPAPYDIYTYYLPLDYYTGED